MRHNAWTAFAASACLIASACSGGDSLTSEDGGGGVGTTALTLENTEEASLFLARGSFGGSENEIASLTGEQATDWITAQFRQPETLYLGPLLNRQSRGEELCCRDQTFLFWDGAVLASDQLRQRMVFALSQIVVASDLDAFNQPLRVAYYMDILSRNAFGNYRDLLEEVTYSPLMARYLTYLRNRKGDPRSGRMPDENYARELMQLFTIGLVELNMDGTVKRGPDGQPVETYDNDDVVGLARVFTGLSLKSARDRFFWGNGNADDDAEYSPLQIFPEQHSDLEKSFLGYTIPAGTDAESSIDQALDHIFAHPNVAPFISRQLIQRFTASDPEPAYVGRVAQAFEAGEFVASNGVRYGEGRRGDLQATIAAILLDQSLFSETAGQASDDGKVREPILRFLHWARAFEASPVISSNIWALVDTSDPARELGQHPFRSPSVFNFYRPGYVAPGTLSGEAGMTAPELQIVNESSAIGYVNFMTEFVYGRAARRDKDVPSFRPNYDTEKALADRPSELVNHLDRLLTGGRMSESTRTQITDAVDALRLRVDTENEDSDRTQRVQLAVLMSVSSPAYTVLR